MSDTTLPESIVIPDIPAAPVMPQYPALGAADFSQKAWVVWTTMPSVTLRLGEIAAAVHACAIATRTLTASAADAAAASNQDALAALGYRNEANNARNQAVPAAAAALADRARAESAAEAAGRDAQFVADKLLEVSSGPVASFNGRGGAVTLGLNDLTAVAPAATTLEIAAGTGTDLRMYTPADLRAATLAAVTPLSQALEPLMPSDLQPGDIIEATHRFAPKWLKLGDSYLRSTYPITADLNVDRLPMTSVSMVVLGNTSSMSSTPVGADHERGILFLAGGTKSDVIVCVNRATGQHTLQTLSRSAEGLGTTVAKFAPDGSIWAISYTGGGPVVMRVYTQSNGVYSEYAYKMFGSTASAPGAFAAYSDFMVPLSRDTLLAAQASSYQLGAVYQVNAGTIALGAPVLDAPPSAPAGAHFLATVSLSPNGEYLFASNYVAETGAGASFRMYKRVAGTDNFAALPELPYVPGVSWTYYSIQSGCSTWLRDDLLLTFNSVFLEMAGTSVTAAYAAGGGGMSWPMSPVNTAKTRYRALTGGGGSGVIHIDASNKFIAPVPADGVDGNPAYSYLNSVPSHDRQSFFSVSTYLSDVRLTKYSAAPTFVIKPLLTMPNPAVRNLYMRTYDY